MKKLVRFCLVVGLFLVLTTPIYAESQRIDEIVVIGPTRSSAELVYTQLPFAEGDFWHEDYRELVRKRIKALEIFNPMELRVITEPITDDKIRVVIRATDTSIYYNNLIEFAIMKTVDLGYRQINQTFRNPFGNGYNIEVGFNWSQNPWWKIGTHFNVGNGFTGEWQHLDFDRGLEFNGTNYNEDGYQEKVELEQVVTEDIRLLYGMIYQDSRYEGQRGEYQQQYLKGKMEIINDKYGYLHARLVGAKSLVENNQDFYQLEVDYTDNMNLGPGQFVYKFQGGISNPETPLNHQFHIGGFREIPIRGYSFDMAGDRYAKTTIEYHQPIFVRGLNLILFTDVGKIISDGKDLTSEEWLFGKGAGVSYNTPLGAPIRLDVGFNKKGDYKINFGFGNSF